MESEARVRKVTTDEGPIAIDGEGFVRCRPASDTTVEEGWCHEGEIVNIRTGSVFEVFPRILEVKSNVVKCEDVVLEPKRG